ncbi:hypothetical protein [Thermocrinis sp.]|jgi:deoxyribose-phosphate aldolase|uniref:hypothetical protein n=1 Tax=Thermocrinis sp. TaxID=2024383 RepID=UPI003BFB1F56
MHKAEGLYGLCPSLQGDRAGGRRVGGMWWVSFPFGMDTKEQKLFQCLEKLEKSAKELRLF